MLRCIRLLLIAWLAALTGSAPLGAAPRTADCAAPAFARHFSDRIALPTLATLGGAFGPVARLNDLAVIGEGAALRVVRIATNGQLVRLGRLLLAEEPQAIAIHNGFAFVTVGSAGLRVVSLSNPNSPSSLYSLSLPGLAAALAPAGDRLYVASAGVEGGLLTLNISNPRRPYLVSTTPVYGSASGLAIADNRLYVAAGLGGGVQIFDLSDPDAPLLLGQAITPGPALDVSVRGERAYLAAGVCGLQIVDVTDPAAPVLLDALSTGGDALDLSLDGTRLYAAADQGGVRVFDLSSGAPVPSAQLPALGAAALDLSATHALVSAPSVGLHHFSLSPTPRLLATLGADAPVRSVALLRPTVALSAVGDGVQSIDLRTPSAPLVRSTLPLSATAQALAVSGSVAYAALGRDGIAVIDASAPLSLTLAATLPISGSVSRMQVISPSLYLAAGSAGVLQLDLSEPLSPTLRQQIATPNFALGVALSGTLGLVAASDALHTFDPISGTISGTFSVTRSDTLRDVAIVGTTAAVAANSGLYLIDVSDPLSPTYLLRLKGFSAYRVTALDATLVAVATGNSGVRIFDLRDPQAPQQVGRVWTPGTALEAAAAPNLLLIADGPAGLRITRRTLLDQHLALPLILGAPKK